MNSQDFLINNEKKRTVDMYIQGLITEKEYIHRMNNLYDSKIEECE